MFFQLALLFSSGIYPVLEFLDNIVALFFDFEEFPYCLPQWLHQFIFPLTVYKDYLSPHCCQYLLFVVFLIIAILKQVRCSLVILICMSMMISNVVHLFICLLWKMSIQAFCPFLNQILFFFKLNYISLYVLGINPIINHRI